MLSLLIKKIYEKLFIIYDIIYFLTLIKETNIMIIINIVRNFLMRKSILLLYSYIIY